MIFKKAFYVIEHNRAIADTLFTFLLFLAVLVLLLSTFVALFSRCKQVVQYGNNSFFAMFSIWTVLDHVKLIFCLT